MCLDRPPKLLADSRQLEADEGEEENAARRISLERLPAGGDGSYTCRMRSVSAGAELVSFVRFFVPSGGFPTSRGWSGPAYRVGRKRFVALA